MHDNATQPNKPGVPFPEYRQPTTSDAGDAADQPAVLTDGGVELRDGEPRDDSHARRNAEALASLRRERYRNLLESEKAVLELLVAADGQLRAAEVKPLAASKTGLTTDAIQTAADRLAEKGLLGRVPVPTEPTYTRWRVTEDGRAWVRTGRDSR